MLDTDGADKSKYYIFWSQLPGRISRMYIYSAQVLEPRYLLEWSWVGTHPRATQSQKANPHKSVPSQGSKLKNRMASIGSDPPPSSVPRGAKSADKEHHIFPFLLGNDKEDLFK